MKKITLSDIDPSNIPAHVAVIMDGNGRWAEKRSQPRLAGHRRGAEILEPVIDAAIELGIKYFSVYAFSVENWSRPKAEVQGLWMLLEYFFRINIQKMCDKNLRILHSGSMKELPGSTAATLQDAIERTRKNRGMAVNFCINYGGRQEIVGAVNSWLEKRRDGEMLTEKKLRKELGIIPDVDLLIRTSGEYRLSNFYLWQAAYTEFYFSKVLWPDFGAQHLYRAVYEYQKRERRFGGI